MNTNHFKQDHIRYINALEAARTKETDGPFFNFMYSQYSIFLKKGISMLK